MIRATIAWMTMSVALAALPSLAQNVGRPAVVRGGARIIVNGQGQPGPDGPATVTIRGGANGQAWGVANGQGNMNMTFRTNGTRQEINVVENQRRVSISSDNGQIRMTVTEADGTARQYEAKNAAELQASNPEAFQIFQKYANVNVGMQTTAQLNPQMDAEQIHRLLAADAEEWAVLKPYVEKLLTARVDVAGATAQTALQRVLADPKVTAEQMEEKTKGLRDAREKVQKALDQAQKDLREVLTTRQEAILMSLGYLE